MLKLSIQNSYTQRLNKTLVRQTAECVSSPDKISADMSSRRRRSSRLVKDIKVKLEEPAEQTSNNENAKTESTAPDASL